MAKQDGEAAGTELQEVLEAHAAKACALPSRSGSLSSGACGKAARWCVSRRDGTRLMFG